MIVVIVTLVGMILGGRQNILEQPEGERVEMSIVNIFTYADSVAALIWASCLASVVLFIMLRVQKILKLSQFVEVEFQFGLLFAAIIYITIILCKPFSFKQLDVCQ